MVDPQVPVIPRTEPGQAGGGGLTYCRLVGALFEDQAPSDPDEYVQRLADGWTVRGDQGSTFGRALRPEPIADEIEVLRTALNESTRSGDPAPLTERATTEAADVIVGYNEQNCS